MLYIDSADRPAVERLLATGLFAGVTTNPTILNRAGLDVDDSPDVYAWLAGAGAGTVFFQAVGTDPDALAEHGRELRGLGANVVVKLPATAPGLTAARRLTREGTPVLVTAVYHASQALSACAAGAEWIAPYVGRMSDLGRDGVAEAVAMHAITRAAGGHAVGGTPALGTAAAEADAPDAGGCRVIAASLRDVDQVARLAAGGVPDFTLSVALCDALLADPLTVQAAADFEAVARRAG